MLSPFQIKDTIEKLHFRKIKEDCVICDTHLVAIIAVSWANLFEKKAEDAIPYIVGLSNIEQELWFPVQLTTQSRPKSFLSHFNEIKRKFWSNDFKLKFKKDIEWFEMYYQKEVESWVLSKNDVIKKYNEAPEYIERYMLESYKERLDTMVRNNYVLEKRYYIVISTLDQPSKISEKDEQNYVNINLDNEEVFDEYKAKLEDRVKKTLWLLRENSWMAYDRLTTNILENLLFDYFNFPLSTKHKINTNITEYWGIPPILDHSKINNENESVNTEKWFIKFTEKIINKMIDLWSLSYSEVWNREVVSNEILQLIKPFSIDDSSLDYVKINDQFCYTIHINRFWDEYLEDLVLWPILTMPYFYDLSVHIIPLNKELVLQEIKKKQQKIKLDFEERKKGKSFSQVTYEKDVAEGELWRISSFESALRNKWTGVYSPSIDITFRAWSLEELEEIKENVRNKLSDKKIFFSEATSNHYSGFISTAPLLTNLISWYNRPFERFPKTLEEISHYYPFCPDSIQSNKWTILGLSKQWNDGDEIKNIEFFDYFDRSRILNSIIMVIWNSWSGKTTTAHQLFKNQELLWYKHYILDYLGNYIKWAADMPDRYQVIKVDPASRDKINPCDLFIPSNDYLDDSEQYQWLSDKEIKEMIINSKVNELSNYYMMFLEGEYNQMIRWILDSTTKNVYKKRLEDIDIRKTKYYWDILLSDIVEELKNTDVNDEHKETTKRIASMLSQFATGSMSGMFNSKTNIEFNTNKSIVFYLHWNNSSHSEELATMLCFLIIKWLVYKNKNCILAIDELHKVFRMESSQIQNFFRSQIAEIRNQDGWILGMTQLLKQVMLTPAGQEFFELSQTKLYLAGWFNEWDENTDITKYDSTLSESSKRFLSSNNRPWYWIFKTAGEQLHIKIDNHPDLSMYQRYKPPKDN